MRLSVDGQLSAIYSINVSMKPLTLEGDLLIMSDDIAQTTIQLEDRRLRRSEAFAGSRCLEGVSFTFYFSYRKHMSFYSPSSRTILYKSYWHIKVFSL
jgi:hypothetical protein